MSVSIFKEVREEPQPNLVVEMKAFWWKKID